MNSAYFFATAGGERGGGGLCIFSMTPTEGIEHSTANTPIWRDILPCRTNFQVHRKIAADFQSARPSPKGSAPARLSDHRYPTSGLEPGNCRLAQSPRKCCNDRQIWARVTFCKSWQLCIDLRRRESFCSFAPGAPNWRLCMCLRQDRRQKLSTQFCT